MWRMTKEDCQNKDLVERIAKAGNIQYQQFKDKLSRLAEIVI